MPWFFLFCLLFPRVNEAVHDFAHEKDTICHVNDITHFHATEHHCPVCDYAPSSTEKPSGGFLFYRLTINSVIPVPACQDQPAEPFRSTIFLRGPPVVS